MLCSVLKNVSKVLTFNFGNRDTFKSFTSPSIDYAYSRSPGGSILQWSSTRLKHLEDLKAPKKACKTISKSVNDSEERIDVFHSILMDEGYYSASTSKQFENTVSKLELCYDQLRSEFELKPHNNFGVNELTEDEEENFKLKGKSGKRIVKETFLLEEHVDEDYEKYFKGFINETWYYEETTNELTYDDEEDYFKEKGKGGKMLVKKSCHLEEKHVEELIDDDNNDECFKGKGWRRFMKRKSHSKEKEQDLKLKEQYLNKIETKKDDLKLDEETQIMICKIDSLRGSAKIQLIRC